MSKIADVFTDDHFARTGERLGFIELLKNIIFSPGFRVVISYRLMLYLIYLKKMNRASSLIARLMRARLCSVPGVEFRNKEPIGRGLLMFHPHDIVIGSGAIIGNNTTIYNGVTLGAKNIIAEDKNDDNNRYPIVGNGVVIFTGAKLIGPIVIGDNSIIGANSVVINSFPDNCIIAGIPAKIIHMRNYDDQ